MARKAYTPPPVIVRPPLTPDDAARVAGTLKHGDGRPDFLRKTVDMIDRSDCDAESRLRRFVQDWQHHARAKMLVELGETLAWLVEGVGPDTEALQEANERAKVVDEILAKVPGFDEVDDLDPEYLCDVMTFLHALGEEYGTETDTGGIKALRKKLIDDRPAEGESVDEVRAELKASEESVADLKKQNAALRSELQAIVNRIGHLHGEASRVAEDFFGVTPVRAVKETT